MSEFSVPVTLANEENFRPYGNLFTNPEQEKVRLERWPQHPRGFRPIADGLGGGVTTGKFTLEWKLDSGKWLHYAQNSGVSDGDYCFARSNGFQFPTESKIQVTNEINYHACGSQFFWSSEPLILLVGKITEKERWPDQVKPSDFRAFLLPPGTGAHIDSYIWHSPPISTDFHQKKSASRQIEVITSQAKVHSKVYYDPVQEDGIVLEIVLPEDRDTHK